jgi:hypothetical protein
MNSPNKNKINIMKRKADMALSVKWLAKNLITGVCQQACNFLLVIRLEPTHLPFQEVSYKEV